MIRRQRKKTIVQQMLDLTPMLDVIFLMLIVVLCFQDKHGEDIERKMQENNSRMEAMEGKYAAMEARIEDNEEIFDHMNLITIYASYSPSNRRLRTVHVGINDNEMWEKDIITNNEDSVWEECKEYIEEMLSDSTDNPTVFSIKDEKMLYRDEQAILKIYDSLEVDNLFFTNDMEN